MSPKAPSPKPMPLTSMPDRVYPPDQRDAGQELKAGIKPDSKMDVNPGRQEEK
jgi:hypothetical protein